MRGVQLSKPTQKFVSSDSLYFSSTIGCKYDVVSSKACSLKSILSGLDLPGFPEEENSILVASCVFSPLRIIILDFFPGVITLLFQPVAEVTDRRIPQLDCGLGDGGIDGV